jgi:uncharacterized protein YfdQ (DUF2303 family)
MDRTNADAVAELALKGVVTPQTIVTASGREFLILPSTDGSAAHIEVTPGGAQLDADLKWIDQKVVVQTTDSLVKYVERFALEDTSLFADIMVNRIVAVIDYHGEALTDGEPTARRGAHKATLDLQHSVEWKLWSDINGKMLGQLEFARFLEENAADIDKPSGADLLETCRDLQATRKVDFRKAVRTDSDNESFEFVDETSASSKKNGSVEIPTRFELRIPVYFGGQTYSIGAFLRWKLEEGEGLKLGIKLHNPEHIRQAVFKEVVATAADQIDRPAYYGKI